MNRRWIFPSIAVAVFAAFVALAWFGPGDRWDHQETVKVVQVAPDGTTTDSGKTIVIDHGRDGFPFPFPILFPFGFFLVLFFVSRMFWGGRRWGGPENRYREQWLNDWHARQHDGGPGDSTPPTAA